MTQSRYQKSTQATMVATKVHHSHLLPTILNATEALCQVLNSRQCGPTLANYLLEGRARHLDKGEEAGIRGRKGVTVKTESIVEDL